MNHSTSIINYLIGLRFGQVDIVLSHEPENEEEQELYTKLDQEVSAYRAELEQMPEEELEVLLATEEARLKLEMQEMEVHQEEQNRFFHQPSAKAGFLAWSLMDKWTLDQATALLLGKEPTVVAWERVSEHIDASPFARLFAQVRVFLEAADIEFPVRPADFIDWAQRRVPPVPVPRELVQLIRANTNPDAVTRPPESSAPAALASTPHPRRKKGSPKLEAAKWALRELFPDGEPVDVLQYGVNQINKFLMAHERDKVSSATAKNAWKAAF